MKLKVFNSYTGDQEEIKISRIKLFFAKFFPMKIDERKYEGWSDYNPFYLFYCKKHKTWLIDYPHGYNKVLWCPKCLEEK
jgi:hypothetical protein